MRKFLIAAALLFASAAPAADVKVLSTVAMTSTLETLSATFEARSGDHLVIAYATASQLKKRIDEGESFDLCILTASLADELINSGKASGQRTDLARSAIGVAVKAGAPKPDISTPEAFKRAILEAKSLAYTTTGVSGVYFQKLAERLGIADAVKSKAHTMAGGAVGELVARGEAELAIQQIVELLPVPGIELVGPFPAELQSISVFSAALSAQAANPAGAKALAAFLTSPDAIATIRLKGMEPG